MRILLSVIQNQLFLNARRMNPSLEAAFECLFSLVYDTDLLSGVRSNIGGQQKT